MSALILGTLVGCSTYSKKQCEQMDLNQKGYELGQNGESGVDVTLAHLKSECEAEHGVVIDRDKIKNGYDKGLRFYCTKEGAIRAGGLGLNYKGVCPDEKIFLENFSASRLVFLETKVRELTNQNEELKSSLESERQKNASQLYEISNLKTQLQGCKK